MTTHITQNGTDSICNNVLGPEDEIITIKKAVDADGPHFDCRDCHMELTGGRRHSGPS
jgi:hypothetical protein